jgi:hypothetical protein
MSNGSFSEELKGWLKSKEPKTLEHLTTAFEEKSFAVLFFILSVPSALPIPTGGLTNVFEIIIMLLALQMVIGRRTLWIPRRWKQRKISRETSGKMLSSLIRRIEWLERHTRPRLQGVLSNPIFLRLSGLLVLLFALGAFVAPPFTGFETLPSLGIVILALGLILEDAALFFAGALVGSIGIGIEIALSRVVIDFVINHIWTASF